MYIYKYASVIFCWKDINILTYKIQIQIIFIFFSAGFTHRFNYGTYLFEQKKKIGLVQFISK